MVTWWNWRVGSSMDERESEKLLTDGAGHSQTQFELAWGA